MACQRSGVNKKTGNYQLEFVTIMLQRYPNPQDWYRVLFSDKIHFKYGPQDKLHIIWKLGIWYFCLCIQEKP